MKKLVIGALAALAFSGVVFAQEVTVEFENKISSDVVTISGGNTEFAGIKEQVTTDVETEKVNLGISLITYFEKDFADNFGFTGYELDKAYIELKTSNLLSIDFNKKVFTAGSYLPIADDNVGNGNIANDFALLISPFENLTVAAGINLPSVFSDVPGKFDFSVGLDFVTDNFTIGAAFRSPINNLGFGVFGSFTGVENLELNLGFSYNDEFCDIAGNILTLGATYEVSIFTIGFDFVTNFKNAGNDLYTALCLETGISDSLIIETQAALNLDFDDSTATETIAELGAAYVVGNHKFRVGIAADITDSVAISFPVYYKYSF